MNWVIAFFQKTPKTKAHVIGILFYGEDENVYCFNGNTTRAYHASLVTKDNHILLSNSPTFLKELSNQDKVSQISYMYTENADLVAEYDALLRG